MNFLHADFGGCAMLIENLNTWVVKTSGGSGVRCFLVWVVRRRGSGIQSVE